MATTPMAEVRRVAWAAGSRGRAQKTVTLVATSRRATRTMGHQAAMLWTIGKCRSVTCRTSVVPSRTTT
jgi:hypothetical protein